MVAVDIRRESLADAKKYGADEIYTPNELPDGYVTGNNMAKNGFPLVMEWGETAESLDLAINMTRMCGQLAIGAYHTGGKRLVDVQQLNVKAIDCLSAHPCQLDLSIAGAENAVKMLSDLRWCYQGIPTKIYPASKFDLAHAELEEKYGRWMKSLIDWSDTEFEPYII